MYLTQDQRKIVSDKYDITKDESQHSESSNYAPANLEAMITIPDTP